MKIRRVAAVGIFVLKTIHFSPVSNPSFWILAILGGVFFLGNDLGKHETVLLLLLVGISNRLMPATNAKRFQPDVSSDVSLAGYARLLPVDNRSFFFAFLLASVAYVVPLISICFSIGMVRETPPVIASICPVQTVLERAPSGEPLVSVEGLIALPDSANVLQPFRFTVPVHYSLLFGRLASEVLFDHHKVTDSVFQRLCPVPATIRSPSEIFSSIDKNASRSNNYSTFLRDLRSVHFSRLLAISCFVCLVFLIDATGRYRGERDRGRLDNVFKWVDYAVYATYALLCAALLLDVLLPELIIARVLLMMNAYKTLIVVFFAAEAAAGVFRILHTTFARTDGHAPPS